MKAYSSPWFWWYFVQGLILTAGYFLAAQGAQFWLWALVLTIIEGGLLLVSAISAPKHWISRLLKLLAVLIQLIVYPLIVFYSGQQFLRVLPGNLSLILVAVLILLAHIPFAKVLFTPDQHYLTRVITTLVVAFMVIYAGTTFTEGLTKSAFASPLWSFAEAGVLAAIVSVLVGAIAMHQWDLPLPSWRFNPNMQAGVLIVLVVFIIYFTLWNAFSTNDWFQSLFIWSWHSNPLTFNWFAQGLEPGIAEEWEYRYMVLTLLLVWLSRHRLALSGSIFISGLLFGASHLINVLGEQNWFDTLSQIQFAAVFGWFIATVYLYVGSFTIPMLVHATIDILSMVVSNTEASITGSTTVYLFQTIVEVVMIGLTIWLLTGRRRQTMQWTLDRIMPAQGSLKI